MDMDNHLDQTLTLQVRHENQVLGGGSRTLTQEAIGVAGLSPPWAISVSWEREGSENAPGRALPGGGPGWWAPSTFNKSRGEGCGWDPPSSPEALFFYPSPISVDQ